MRLIQSHADFRVYDDVLPAAKHVDHDPDSGLPYPQYAMLFPRGEAQTHGSGGIGLALQPHFQIDVGFDVSDLDQTLAVSTIWKF